MREIPLKQYFGTLFLCKSRKEFRKVYKSLTGERHATTSEGGCANWVTDGEYNKFLVFADDKSTLAHELLHVILFVFAHCKIDPCAANGEPACYMLSHLLDECNAVD